MDNAQPVPISFFDHKLMINHEQAVNKIHHNDPNCILFVCNLETSDNSYTSIY